MLVPAHWIIDDSKEDVQADSGEVWACPMLCVKRSGPGKCPVCGMELEKLENTGDAVLLDNAQATMIGLETADVELRALSRQIRTVGVVDYNERRVRTISAWVAGRIDRLYADHTYAEVRRDDHVMQLYSPSLYAAQQELLIGGGSSGAARRRLELLGMSTAQIETLLKTGKAQEQMDILSPISGKVIDLKVSQGDYVKVGTPLYVVADFSSFWLRFDAYEDDLPWIVVGQGVDVTLDALPGRTIRGTVSFIEGVVDPVTRTIKVRVTVDNANGALMPGMFADVAIKARLTDDGRAERPSLAGRFTCYMHPSVHLNEQRACPICGMPTELHPHADTESASDSKVLTVPYSAVLKTGERSVVYVETKRNRFELREIVAGARAGDWIHVLKGLKEGETVATGGALLIDSQMQLTGRPSLLVPGGGTASGGHQH